MLTLLAPEQQVPKTHPLRRIKQLAGAALQALSPTFDVMYAEGGRPSVPPERLLKSTLLMAFYSVRSDRRCGARRRAGDGRWISARIKCSSDLGADAGYDTSDFAACVSRRAPARSLRPAQLRPARLPS